MTMIEACALIAGALLKKDGLTPQEIHYSTKIPLIQIYRAIKGMEKDELITIKEGENNKHYHVNDVTALKKFMDTVDDREEVEPEKEQNEEKPKPPSNKEATHNGRHTGKFIFRKVAYSKSMCAYQVVSAFVNEKKPTLKELEEAFDPSIVSRFGVVATLDKAKELSGDRVRYHMKDHMILTTKDKQQAVVTNQWSITRFEAFAEAAEKVGYKVKAE